MVVFVLFGQAFYAGKPAPQEAVAVLELFTSQGCNSCPAADKLLAQTVQEAALSGKKIIALSFHVDYWDRLGWKDPYSKKAWSQRQYDYANALGSQVYTPQAVINGTAELVGSDKNRLEKALQKAWQTPQSVSLSADKLGWDGKKATGTVSLSGSYQGLAVYAVLFAKATENHIPRGENAGITLKGSYVVREMQRLTTEKAQSFSLDIPADLKKENAGIVLFTQDPATLRITGAVMTGF